MGRSFISYAHEDSDIAEFLHQDLSDIGADPWMDTHDIIAGQNWTNVITEVIREAMAVIVLLSANSVSKRGVLQFEIKLALDALKTIPPGDVFLIPVRLDDCTPRDDQLRELQWVDLFPSYESGLAQIRRGLDALSVRLR